MITIALEGDRALIQRFRAMPDQVREALWKAVGELSINLRNKVQAGHLSGPTGAHSLSVVTGRLRASVHSDRFRDATSVTGEVYFTADVPYAAIHEFGGTINHPGGTPYFIGQGGLAQFVSKAAADAHLFPVTAAHEIMMPERAPLRTAFREYSPTIKAKLEEAVRRSLSPNH